MQNFKDIIRAAGLTPPDTIIPGVLHRCKLFVDGRGGWFMDYSTGLFEVWQARRDKPYTEAERQAFKAQAISDRAAREAETLKAHQQAATKTRKLWQRAIYADAGNGYLHRKKIQAHGTKTFETGGHSRPLITPLYNENLKLVNLQFIQPDGTKRFLKGGQKQGCFWWIGKETPTVLIAEGFATAASVHEDTGKQVFIAFDAGNLTNVAKTVRAKTPNAAIIICGDNDHSGTGQKAARQAALACGGKYLIPPKPGMDWNDWVNGGAA